MTRHIRHFRKSVIGMLAPMSMAGALVASPADAATGARTVNHNCHESSAGRGLDVRLSYTFRGSRTLDLERVSVRATDDGESGSWRNKHVNLRQIRIKVSGDGGKLRVNRTSAISPFVVSMNPNSRTSGKDAIAVAADVVFSVNGTRKATVSCFDFFE